VLLIAVVVLVFWPALGNGFVSWDDQWYVLENKHLAIRSIGDLLWLFTHSYYWSYIPLTLLSHALDVALWGPTPFGPHLTNLVLHAANTVWVFLLALLVLRIGSDASPGARTLGAFAAALVFSLHPLRAESVAWVSDRKDLLCAFFLLPALMVYLRARIQGGEAPRSSRWLTLSLSLYVCALLSKATALMLPVVLVLLERLLLRAGEKGEDSRRSIARVAPFAGASLVVGIVGLASTPARTLNFLTVDLSTAQKLLLPFYTIVAPLGTLLWPHHLGPIYDYPEGLLSMLLSLVIVLLVSVAAGILYRMRLPGIAVAWSVYLAMSVPTALFFLTGIQPLADRYSYLSMVSLALLAGAGLVLASRSRTRIPRNAIMVAGVVIIGVLLGTSTRQQVTVWRSSLSLWAHAVRVAPSSPVAFNNLGQAHLATGALEEASMAFTVAARLKSDYADVYNNMGVVSILRGDVRGGRRLLEQARALLEAAPDPGTELPDVYRNLGRVHHELGEQDSALASYRRCLAIQPQDALAWHGISQVLLAMGHPDEARRARVHAARLGNPEAKAELAGEGREALREGEKEEDPP